MLLVGVGLPKVSFGITANTCAILLFSSSISRSCVLLEPETDKAPLQMALITSSHLTLTLSYFELTFGLAQGTEQVEFDARLGR
jgi:hypothetical protein